MTKNGNMLKLLKLFLNDDNTTSIHYTSLFTFVYLWSFPQI